ncbi:MULTISPECIES: GNAT family N-acetyltransferase [unclassified Streptomyces]|uniref:GNAT family N-acetyltransferase n=1 Tax=unclassified Streptomyces TaxID=2593676 RepID=UPI002259A6A8|nr:MULTISPECIES: GNAT family N-acetyltransferase [unclassified Streptomyces]MCX5335101.1 GNAT family N-acetyltransferase [Streptomyces sp. NBC_00140]MCX5364597.1 GNAT family N-acetyltransferase [Streptomyces sp. NBC_00124]
MIHDRAVGARVIRTAVPAEAEAVAALHARARATYYPGGIPDDGTDWLAAWQGAIARPDGHVLCLVDDGRIVALASFRTPEGAPAETVKLFQFHVDPDRWRSGVGTALHTACVEQWQADGKRTAVLEVHVDNARAQAFYTRQGWAPHPVEAGHHHLRMTLPVAGE